jgi:hypothetical protein
MWDWIKAKAKRAACRVRQVALSVVSLSAFWNVRYFNSNDSMEWDLDYMSLQTFGLTSLFAILGGLMLKSAGYAILGGIGMAVPIGVFFVANPTQCRRVWNYYSPDRITPAEQARIEAERRVAEARAAEEQRQARNEERRVQLAQAAAQAAIVAQPPVVLDGTPEARAAAIQQAVDQFVAAATDPSTPEPEAPGDPPIVAPTNPTPRLGRGFRDLELN